MQQRIARETTLIQVLRERVQTLQDWNWQQAEATGRFVAENGILERMLEQLQQTVEAVNGDYENDCVDVKDKATSVVDKSPESSSDLSAKLGPKQASTEFQTQMPQQEAKKDTQEQPETSVAPASPDKKPREALTSQTTKRKAPEATNDGVATSNGTTQQPPLSIKKIKLWSSKTHYVYKCPVPHCNRQIPFCKAATATPPLDGDGGVSDQAVWSADHFDYQIQAARKHMRTKHSLLVKEHWPPGFAMQPDEQDSRAVPQPQQQQPNSTGRSKVLAKYPPQKENDSLKNNSPLCRKAKLKAALNND